VDEPVDRARAADHLAARVEDRASVRAGIGFGMEPPGERWMIEELHEARGDVDVGAAVLSAGFDQDYFRAGILGQAIGKNASCRPCANDHIVSLHTGLLLRGWKKTYPVTPGRGQRPRARNP